MIIPTDNQFIHAILALAVAFLLVALVVSIPLKIDGSIFMAGVTIGVVLAGFTIQNRTFLTTQRDAPSMKSLIVYKDHNRLMEIFCWTIVSSIVLSVVSVLCMLITVRLEIRLFFWLPFLVFTITYFLRCEQTVSGLIDEILNDKENQLKKDEHISS